MPAAKHPTDQELVERLRLVSWEAERAAIRRGHEDPLGESLLAVLAELRLLGLLQEK